MWSADDGGSHRDGPRIVVLGASGLIGSALTRHLARRPIRLRVVSRRPVRVPAAAVADVEVRTADLTVPANLVAAVTDADAVIHLVAHLEAASWRVDDGDSHAERVNVGVMRHLVEAIRSRRRTGPPPVVVFAGSTSQVGTPATRPLTGAEPDDPVTAYDRQKLAAERVLADATAEGSVRGLTLRLATVFGDGADVLNDRGVVATMLRRALADEPLCMWHDGRVHRDLVPVADASRALLVALGHADALVGRHWLVGTGEPVRLADLFRTIAAVASRHTGRPPVPVVSVPPPEYAKPTDFHSFLIDSSAFRAATGWRHRIPLRMALDRAAAALTRGAHPVCTESTGPRPGGTPPPWP